MEQKKFEKILNSLYPDLKIVDYALFERFEVSEDGGFTNKITPAIFVTVKGNLINREFHGKNYEIYA
jgi:hypothetical protein